MNVDLIVDLLGAIILESTMIYICSKLLRKKINFKNIKLYFYYILLLIITVINYNVVDLSIRIIIITLSMLLLISRVFNTSIKEGIVVSLFYQVINLIPEVIFTIIVFTIVQPNIDMDNYSIILTFIADIFVSFLTILIVKLKFIRNLYDNIIHMVNRLSYKIIVLFTVPLLFIFNAYISTTYYIENTLYMILLNYGSIYLVIIIVFLLVKRDNQYNKIYEKYSITLNSLREYEDMLDKYKVLNHENKNQLQTIRNMIPKNNKKTIGYIDTLIKNKIKDNEKIMQEVSKIPSGGLRGIIYSKILLMKEKNINYSLIISNKLTIECFIDKIDDQTMLDICNIVGVYLDNAINASLLTDNPSILIEIYLDEDDLAISISNKFIGNLDLDKIEERGYTTNGKGHGYGLSLAKLILKRNKKLSNCKCINKNVFSQILKIKI